jgi:hypothetical protein
MTAWLRGVYTRSPTAGGSRAADPDPRDGEIHVWPVQGNVYLLMAYLRNTVMVFLTSGIEPPALRATTSISALARPAGTLPPHTNVGSGLQSRTTNVSRRHWY